MIHLLLAAQLLAPVPQEPAYTSPALRALVDRAAERNRAAPPSLESYRAEVESEIAVLVRRADGEESAVSLEQSQNDVHWQRSGEYDQHVTAYRARQAGPSLSALAVLRNAWTIPVLYGNRLSLFLGDDSSASTMREHAQEGVVPTRGSSPGRTVLAVHPFGPGRERVYHFSGGDTIAVIRTGQRAISIVRVQVEPRGDQVESPVVVFRGEINLDAERGEIVRMRGQFLTLGKSGPQKRRLLVLPVSVLAYVDLESVELDGRYWLPLTQRIEKHVNVGGLAEGRSVFRIVSRFRNHEVNRAQGGEVVPYAAPGDDTAESPDGMPPSTHVHRLTVAADDTPRIRRNWWLPLGGATAALRADDFADVGAASSALLDVPRWSWQAQRLADVVHFNRVEGWSTGAAVVVVPGTRAPGVTLRGNAGWAWTQQTIRGRIEAMRAPSEGTWTAGMRLGRTLDITNDFAAPHDSGGALLAALSGKDDYDYVDRTAATLWVAFDLVPRMAFVRLESGLAADRSARARLTRGLVRGDVPLGPNRGVDPGDYGRAALVAEWNPAVNASALASGLGAQLSYEAAAGRLSWQRTTLRVTARRDVGAFAGAMRIDGGRLVSRDAPPQQLFELGGGAEFPGYAYKEFAGDRALATHWRAMYRLPLLRAPLRLLDCTCLSAPAPALAITLHSARLSAKSAGTMASIARLGSVGDRVGYAPAAPGAFTAVSRPTDGWRTSLDLGVRFFGGAVTLGMARVMEPGRPWRMSFALGQAW